ncbi:MAG: hypothetical protein OT477_04655 [Chloroflexi bacterium]|nr:hypothetical protein [Chloroflexota bacterium]
MLEESNGRVGGMGTSAAVVLRIGLAPIEASCPIKNPFLLPILAFLQ